MRQSRKRDVVLILLLLICLLAAGGATYVGDYYKCEEEVQSYFLNSDPVRIEEMENGLLLDGPGSENAFVFYPGAKVEYTAYVPLLYQIAENGTDVFLLKMPCNLAFLGMNRADDIISSYEYEHWYLGGHSLGGAMAAARNAPRRPPRRCLAHGHALRCLARCFRRNGLVAHGHGLPPRHGL